jgi:dTDP-glucose 4,6-dehydratase/UDP-glucose 4-epimerase
MGVVLVTGGAGFIGSALARRLHEEGHTVRVLDNFSRGTGARLHRNIVQYVGDIRTPPDVEAAADGCDAIYHLAYVQGTQTFYEDPRRVIDIALMGIINVLGAAEGKDFILVSSSEVYQVPPAVPTDESVPLSVPDVTNPRYSYGGGKIASEVAAMAYSHAGALGRLVIVRPHNIYGPDMGEEHVIPQLARRIRATPVSESGFTNIAIQGTGTQTRSFCHIDDCVDGLALLLDKGADRGIYHLGNPEEITILGLARSIGDLCGRQVLTHASPAPAGAPPRRLPDIGKMTALGYSPKVPLAAGLPDAVSWYV